MRFAVLRSLYYGDVFVNPSAVAMVREAGHSTDERHRTFVIFRRPSDDDVPDMEIEGKAREVANTIEAASGEEER